MSPATRDNMVMDVNKDDINSDFDDGMDHVVNGTRLLNSVQKFI